MKFLCSCGQVVRDQTDYLPYKGHIISDQDYYDFMNVIEDLILKSSIDISNKEREENVMNIYRLAGELFRVAYECPKCGKLYFESSVKSNELKGFSSDNLEVNRIFASGYGDKWLRPLIGSWNDHSDWDGYITYGVGTEYFSTWEELETRYYNLFEEYRNKSILRNAMLNCNHNQVHKWDKE